MRAVTPQQENSRPNSDMTPFQWWYSTDGERYFGPHATRDEAIEAGRAALIEALGDDIEGSSLDVCEARQLDESDITVDADDVLQCLETTYEEDLDPEDDDRLVDCTAEQRAALTECLTEAFRGWLADNGLRCRFWNFHEARNEEKVALQNAEDSAQSPA